MEDLLYKYEQLEDARNEYMKAMAKFYGISVSQISIERTTETRDDVGETGEVTRTFATHSINFSFNKVSNKGENK